MERGWGNGERMGGRGKLTDRERRRRDGREGKGDE